MLTAMDLSLLVMLLILTNGAAGSKPLSWARTKVRATASRCRRRRS
jgi:hypothetical protein